MKLSENLGELIVANVIKCSTWCLKIVLDSDILLLPQYNRLFTKWFFQNVSVIKFKVKINLNKVKSKVF